MRTFRSRMHLSESLGLSALGWIVFALCLWHWWPGMWPWDRVGPAKADPVNFGLLMLIAQALFIKTYLMFRRTRIRTTFGWSLIAMNAAFAVVYTMALVYTFWPRLRLNHDLQLMTRLTVAVPVAWALLQLIRSEDPAPETSSPWALVDALIVERDDLRTQNATLLEIVRAQQ